MGRRDGPCASVHRGSCRRGAARGLAPGPRCGREAASGARWDNHPTPPEISPMKPPPATLLLPLAAPAAFADDPVTPQNVEPPDENKKHEPLAKEFSMAKAAHFIDSAALMWHEKHKCFSCHSNYSY